MVPPFCSVRARFIRDACNTFKREDFRSIDESQVVDAAAHAAVQTVPSGRKTRSGW